MCASTHGYVYKETLVQILLAFHNVSKGPEHLELAGTQLCRPRMQKPDHLVDHLDIVQKQMLTLLNRDHSLNSFGWVIQNG